MTLPVRQIEPRTLELIRARVHEAGIFADVRLEQVNGMPCLVCDAAGSAEPAFYSLFVDDGRVWVALQTPARYLSQSIEADLMFTGDKLTDLLHEELMDLGWDNVFPGGPELPVEHFRTSDARKLYTFRSPLPAQPTANADALIDAATIALLAYHATFCRLGDMQDEGDS